ncbi:putative acetyltransferase [Chryseobacterium sp. SORGH_AS 447]|uniref:GNAT family N-acetyltransferase n=1 Tax=Chryseobacterium sp. SORGH_AS_0447 TaxID=3041769 RepID=UPI00278B955A|nr:GNAT family N-acetyltransferase [Chryseobacterium sp. SORGH_AS_0447]MDQ1161597.1 putative acetyltransferase [Chryseobacterium sp. SORGH_AS_0447]
MEQTVIRKAEKSDNGALAKLIRDTFTEFDAPKEGTVYSDPTTFDLYSLFTCENSVLWVGEIDGVVSGCCGIYPTEGLPEGCAELAKFYLRPEARGKGLGKSLMMKSIASAKEMGYDNVYLESLPEFSKAVKMYENSGFRLLEKPLGNSGHDSCTLWMIRGLEDIEI